MRQFVSQIALNKNEYSNSSMMRHAEPIKQYLSRLRSARGIEMEARNDTGTSLAVTLTTQTVTSEIDKGRVRSESSARRLIRPPGSRVVRPPRGAPGAAPLLVRSLRGARALFSSLFNDRLNQAIANAKAASRSQDWREAIWRWRKIIDEFGDKAPPKAFLALCDGHRRRGDLDAAQAAAWEGRAKHPTNLRLAVKGAEIEIDRAEIAMARTDWRQAAKCWHTVLDVQAEADFALDGQLIANRRGSNDVLPA